jgi:transcriptional regulator with XRE-family HTH domain
MVKLTIQLHELIRKSIKDRGITQKEFAKLTGINEASLSRLLKSNQTQIDIRTLKKLYSYVPIDFGNLVLVEEETSDNSEK